MEDAIMRALPAKLRALLLLEATDPTAGDNIREIDTFARSCGMFDDAQTERARIEVMNLLRERRKRTAVAMLAAGPSASALSRRAFDRCESKAERNLLAALFERFQPCNGLAIGRSSEGALYQQHAIRDAAGDLIGRADFAIETAHAGFVIEVDGFAYHEGEHVRASDDKLRDRRCVVAGWMPIRFAAIDVLDGGRSAICVDEIVTIIRRWSRLTPGGNR
jgi:hypothetical protein